MMGGGADKVGAPVCPEHSDGLDDEEPAPCTVSETRLQTSETEAPATPLGYATGSPQASH